jgi:transposase
MKLHGNARLSPKGRLLLCRRVLEEGWSLTRAAEAAGVSERTASKWVGRYRVEGELGLVDRSSAPGRVPGRTDEARVELIATLRRVADDRGGDRRVSGDDTLDRVRDLDRGSGWVSSRGSSHRSRPTATSASGRAS